jgi:rod shape-determining protein MreC
MRVNPRKRPSLFSHRSAAPLRLAIFMAASLALMVLDHQQGHLQTVHRGLSVLVYPVETVVNLPHQIVGWASEAFAGRERLLAENRALSHRNLMQQARLERFAALEQENNRLRALLGSAARVKGHFTIAELLAIDLDPFRQDIVIDKGTRDGVKAGQPLADAHGIMGQVTHAGLFTSQAILITDPNHALPVEVNRTGLNTLALGTGDITRLNLPYLPNHTDVQVGDLLVTSGLGGRFPRGYPVGVVTHVQRNPGHPFASVSAKPSAALDRSYEVLILWPPKLRQDGSRLAEAIN